MKNRKTKSMLLGLAMVASVASVGFASWIISSNATVNADQGTINAETVTNNMVTVTPTWTDGTPTILYGRDTSKNAGKATWLNNEHVENSSLEATLELVINNLSVGNKVVVTLKEDGTNLYTPAMNGNYVGALPEAKVVGKELNATTGLEVVKASDGEELFLVGDGTTGNKVQLGQAGLPVTSGKATFSVKFTFTWGTNTNSVCPEEFYTAAKYETAGTKLEALGVTTAGAHAEKVLSEVAKIQNAKFLVTINAGTIA